MRILLTGSTGYIGRRLLPVLVNAGHQVICLVRDKRKFDWEDFSPEFLKHVVLIEVDLEDEKTFLSFPLDFDAAYYLVHSMGSSNPEFNRIESESATNFVALVDRSMATQIIFLGGILNDDDLSDHLRSRKNVEDVLKQSRVPLTVLRAAIIIGSGSASFEIIRDLVEKLPFMIAPKWVRTKCQPIGIRNVIEYLVGVLNKQETYNKPYDIGGSEILTYKEMLYGFARMRGLKRWIISVPFMTPRLSSWWLIFITSTNFELSRSLVSSMKNEVVCRNNDIQEIVKLNILNYDQSLRLAFDKISQKNVISTWKDSLYDASFKHRFSTKAQVPEHGVLTDRREIDFEAEVERVTQNIWSIGGTKGWYAGNWMWRIRGGMDRLVGGPGLRRHQKRYPDLKAGDILDFWRVLAADKSTARLLLYAEMKMPGEAWLEFKIQVKNDKKKLIQTATFRPLGLLGRLYWYAVFPFHGFIFPKMAKQIVSAHLIR